ncbi:hypothetical protein FCULG_00005257 [Fusarium culmorum]|uniref:Uncharacterized protein n=1 Tax=Fusarium culmorum TaxID=5516 RepID=A0A2T4GWR9_FUSCU|nr:hypothetical protein FCULG_00005257 [Fusarium culmorum]
MAVFKPNTESEIPGLRADAHAASFDQVSAIEKFGRKWYASGVEAGLVQAAQDAEDRAKLAQDLIISNEELKKNEIQILKNAAMVGRNALSSAANAMCSIGTASQVRNFSFDEREHLQRIAKEISYRRDECTTSFDSAAQESKKRSSVTQASDGSSSSSKPSKNE